MPIEVNDCFHFQLYDVWSNVPRPTALETADSLQKELDRDCDRIEFREQTTRMMYRSLKKLGQATKNDMAGHRMMRKNNMFNLKLVMCSSVPIQNPNRQQFMLGWISSLVKTN
jgi:hypothetical protein